ncbi:MAG TPA: MFS transporter [Chitinophagaceae bacterium]|nr:MFS transporter [Chitinophagaceae bacterium]
MQLDKARTGSPVQLLRHPEYRNFITARVFYIMAMRMVTTVVGWRIYEMTRNPFAIGLLGLAEFLPAFSLALYAGHMIDKSDKRALLVKTTVGYLLCVTCLIALSTRYSNQRLATGTIQWLIYSVIFCTGVIRAFAGPALNSIIAQIVPRQDLPHAVTLNSSAWLLASVLGHGTAGFLIAHTQYVITFSIIAVYVCIAIVALHLISPKPILLNNSETKTLESIMEGLRYVFKTKEILGAMALDLFAVLFGGAVALIPVFARDILKVGPIGFGWLNAAADIGSITIILGMTIFPLRRKQGLVLMYAVAGFGVCIIIFGLSKWYLLSFIALMFSGFLDGISVVVRSTILQLKTPDIMRGRVSSVNSMFINSSNELGQFESGVMARLLGTINSVVFGGCMTIAVVIFTWFKAPSLRKMEY